MPIPFAAAAVAMWGADKLIGGFTAQGNAEDIKRGRAATWEIYQNKLDLLGRKNKLANEQIGLQFQTGMEKLDIGTAGMMSRQKKQLEKSLRKTGFAVSGEVQTSAELDMNKLWANYRSNQKGLMDTKRISLEGEAISMEGAKMALDEEKERGLAEFAGMPNTFWDGMWT